MRTIIVMADPHYRYIGSSLTVFDWTNKGHCIEPLLPWRNAQDFVDADHIAEMMTDVEFYANVPPDPHIEGEIEGHECEYFQADGIYFIYDADRNIYYFFA